MPRFTDKEHQEILRARARLEKMKNPYGYPDPRDYGYMEPQPEAPHSIYELDAQSREGIQRLKAKVNYLDNQIKELRAKKKEEEITIA